MSTRAAVRCSGCGRRTAASVRLPRHEICLLVLVPLADVENRPSHGRGADPPTFGRGQRQAAGPAEDDLVGRDLGGDVIGIRTNRDAVDRFQQRSSTKSCSPDEAANRRRRCDHQQGIAGVRIDEPMHRPGPGSVTVTLACAGSLMFRIAISGCVGVCIASAKVTVQFAPLA